MKEKRHLNWMFCVDEKLILLMNDQTLLKFLNGWDISIFLGHPNKLFF